MPSDRDVTCLALRTLEDALAQAHHGPVRRTWGHRLALAWMARTGIPLDWHCKAFWTAMSDPHPYARSLEFAVMYRTTNLRIVLDNWYRAINLEAPAIGQRARWAAAYAPAIAVDAKHDHGR